MLFFYKKCNVIKSFVPYRMKGGNLVMQNIEEIYKEYSTSVYKYLFCLTRNKEISEDLTQETFAELMNVSWSYVSKIEAGFLNLSLGKVFEISKFLNIDINVLLEIHNL